jgi:predicted dehydrogenase
LRAAGGGTAQAVASRSLASAQAFAAKHGVERAVEGYAALLDADDLDAVYIPLPNGMHAEWTIAALRAGKAVLCEKPLSASLPEAEQILAVARETGGLLWEAFVFPFHEQTRRVLQIVGSGELGRVGEIRTVFNARIANPDDVRWDPDLAGGALNDLGCYCVHLGTILLGETPTRALAMETPTERGVDLTTQAILEYPSGRRLTLSCSFDLVWEAGATVAGTQGALLITNPFHATDGDFIEIRTGGPALREEWPSVSPTFTPALRRINAAIVGHEAPQHLAVSDALPTATGMELIRQCAR